MSDFQLLAMPFSRCKSALSAIRFTERDPFEGDSIMVMKRSLASLLLLTLITVTAGLAASNDPLIVYEGESGPGSKKRIVLIAGDEEYRSEEALPQLGRILSRHHGFHCTVLFPIDSKDGTINANIQDNIPGLAALQSADMMIIFTRFRRLPDEQMAHIEA